MKPKTITIDDVEYVRKTDIKEKAETFEGLEYGIVRTYSAGVFAGYLKSLEGKKGVVLKARRLWYWDGASSLSQLAVDGTKAPENCKFPCEVNEITLTEVIEFTPCTEKARLSIAEVVIWKQ